jgi:hypothetical protein
VANHREPTTPATEQNRLNKPDSATTATHGQQGEPLYTQGVGGSIPSPPIVVAGSTVGLMGRSQPSLALMGRPRVKNGRTGHAKRRTVSRCRASRLPTSDPSLPAVCTCLPVRPPS